MTDMQNSGNEMIEAAPPLGALASVKINLASVQYAGATLTPKGELPSWRVTFQVGAEYLLGTSMTIHTIGPTDVVEARHEALAILRRYAQEMIEAAENFHA